MVFPGALSDFPAGLGLALLDFLDLPAGLGIFVIDLPAGFFFTVLRADFEAMVLDVIGWVVFWPYPLDEDGTDGEGVIGVVAVVLLMLVVVVDVYGFLGLMAIAAVVCSLFDSCTLIDCLIVVPFLILIRVSLRMFLGFLS
ncbi:hypothetical protein WICPIJ_000353 [Wickerhamomyces pijperi]|uniref:Uncharacterized protein n=1 Tax=Wickerhamomyces pijperi TaxID=599730 RepID=A0A9P8QGT5_WICPI|nr:hypothetical protein WICPIJ_000353 [Wickerhamomyces pijperi]